MSLIFQKLAAGISAAVCLFSAVGSDIAGVRLSRGASSGVLPINVNADSRYGGHLMFGGISEEQDTFTGEDGIKWYNTEQGLHTDKTATAVDGRTFDLDLESWYSGSNPVDLGLVLDASGSMAWTTKDLQPLDVQTVLDKVADDPDKASTVAALQAKYPELEDGITIESLQALQKSNGNFLPEDVVELILDPQNTDDSKLDYNYRYYVYEDRDDVSEFSPLGFWQGSNYAINDSSLLGYYPFEHSLANEAPNADPDATASVVNGDFEPATTLPERVDFNDTKEPPNDDVPDPNTIALDKTAEQGALLSDVTLDPSSAFTVAFRIQTQGAGTEDLPIVYIGDAGCTDFLEIVLSADHETLILRDQTGDLATVQNNEARDDRWVNYHLTYDGGEVTFSNDQSGDTQSGNINEDKQGFENTSHTFTDTALKNIIIGGDRDGHTKGSYPNTGLTDLVVFKDTALDQGTLKKLDSKNDDKKQRIKITADLEALGGILAAQYTFGKKGDDGGDGETGLENLANNNTPLTFIAQPAAGKFTLEILDATPVDPVYHEPGTLDPTTSLDIKAIQDGGNAIKLDAVPDDLNNFTVSFRMRRVGSAGQQHNLFYAGAEDRSDYFQFFRSGANPGYLELSNGAPGGDIKNQLDSGYMYYKGGLNDMETWYTNTLVFQSDDAAGTVTVTPYIDGKPEYQNDDNNESHNEGNIEKLKVDKANAVLLLGALTDAIGNTGVYVDDVYVFNRALTGDEVLNYFGPMPECTAIEDEKNKPLNATHAVNGEKAVAEITKALYRNASQNRGWYYVNTQSSWSELVDCLHGEKQYMGWNAVTTGSDPAYTKEDKATIPAGQVDALTGNIIGDYGQSIIDGDSDNVFTLPASEGRIPFYLDKVNHLRTIIVTGTDKNHVDCSLVYENPEGENHSELKYQTLNRALNEFFDRLYLSSGDSNVSVLRFSIQKMLKNSRQDGEYNSEEEVQQILRQLVLKNWTKMSGGVDQLKDLVTNGTGADAYDSDEGNATFSYALTGGTYTWTGLRAFYEQNILLKRSENADDTGRGKYLIVFTDGRDTANVTNSSYVGYAPDPNGEPANNDAQLARLWANKIKAAGYTIYGVMLSTGSISPDANRTGYSGAYYKLSQVVGEKNTAVGTSTVSDNELPDGFLETEGENEGLPKEENNYIKIATNEGNRDLIDAFQEILDEILKELDNNIVQDYIDPRFDLVDSDDNVYHLGPDGEVTVTDQDGQFVKTQKIGTAIGAKTLDEAQAKGIQFTPRESRTYVNKEGQDTTDADPYLYYDSEKGMYYLRWYGLKIGGASQAFTTGEKGDYGTDDSGKPVYLSDKAWYSTIRIKAKEDFIGGNAILTNGNEPGMNLVFNTESIYGKDGVDGGANTPQKERQTLQGLSGTGNAFFGTSNDINTTASKGFPRTTVNVQLLPIKTKELYDVVYLGEVIDPVEMLGEIEDDYLTDSYYLEYLKRYAERIRDVNSPNTPLIDLLNAWLQIDQEGVVTARTFTIPYIYLPNPTYNSDTGAFNGYANSFGAKTDEQTGRADYDDSNLRDIVGYLTYTWTREKESDTAEEDKYPEDPKQKFIVETTDRISYNLKLQYTPLKEVKAGGDEPGIPKTPLGDKFVGADQYFQVTEGEFASGGTWTYYTRDVLNKALVTDPKPEPDGGEYYEWDSVYKPSVGTAQLDSGTSYGSATIENGESLVANTPYIKDPVNGALALEITINDTDLSILTKDGTEEITLPFTRTYDDPNDNDETLAADVTGEQYELTFTVNADSAVNSTEQPGKHTVIGVLTAINDNYTDPVQLPIGTYTSGSCEGVMFCGRFLQIDGVEENDSFFVIKNFPDAVTGQNPRAAEGTKDAQYLLNNPAAEAPSEKDNCKYNKAQAIPSSGTPASAAFNLGTTDGGVKGKHLDAEDENSREYTKDRLGILKLSTQGAQLPSAGGKGTFPIMLCGLALLAAGGTALLLRKRKARSEAGGDADG